MSLQSGVASARRPLLGFVLGGIVVTAALGLYAVAAPHFGDLQRNVLGTSACVTAAGLLVLACVPAWERGRYRLVPLVGIVGVVIGFGLIVVGMWSDYDHSWFWRTMGTFLIAGLWGVLASLLALARLAPRHRWVLFAAVALALALGALGIAGIWSEQSSTGYFRAVGALAVLLAAAVVAVPVLARATPAGGDIEPRAVGYCPFCGAALSGETDTKLTCIACGADFRVRAS